MATPLEVIHSEKLASTPLPDLSHISFEDFKNVYEPAEDTYLFVDVLEAEATFILGLTPAICLELGFLV
jgi:release factor glutamine methyltransferase